MNWLNRSGRTIAVSLLTLIVFMAVCVALALMSHKAHAAACLSIDVPPQVVLNVHDGDTFHVFSVVPGGLIKIRVQGVDTPELNEPKGLEAKQFTREWLSRGMFKVMTCGVTTFDRMVGIVERNGESLADTLKKAGLSK